MKAITNFNEFLVYENVQIARRELYMNIFRQFEQNESYLNEAQEIINMGIFDDIFEQDIIDESIVSKLADKFKSATEVLKDKGKAALSTAQEVIIKTGGKVAGIIKMIVDAVKQWLGEQWKAAQQAYNSAFGAKADEIKQKVEGMGEEKKNALKTEIKNLKTITSAVGSWIKSGFTNDIAKAASTAAKTDESYIGYSFELGLIHTLNESVLSGELNFVELLNEGEGAAKLPFVSSIASGMNKVPPFSLLYKVKKAAASIAGGVLDKFSFYATELAGAPGPYKFAALATLIGVVAEVQVKGAAKHALIHAIPGIGTAAYLVSNVAMGLAAVAVIEAALGKKKEEKPEEEA
jgi:hypothetical protein